MLVNDRPDIARAACADGIHLTTRSLPAEIVRRAFGSDLLIGVSTHTLIEARAARDGGADFAVFGPVFETLSKKIYGPPAGLERLAETAQELGDFPLIALGGITRETIATALDAGAAGIAGISLFANAQAVAMTMSTLRTLPADV